MEDFRIKMIVLLVHLVIFLIGYLYARLIKTSYYFRYGKEYVFCGTTYTGQMVLARYISKNKAGREHICHSMDIDTSKLKIGCVYSFKLYDNPQEGVLRAEVIQSVHSGLADLAGIENPVTLPKEKILS